MLLILEGPDGAGKTTLAREIENFTTKHFHEKSQYIHHGVTDNPFDLYMRALWNTWNVFSRFHFHIFDRAWPSEHVYGNVYRRTDRLSVEYRMLERVAMTCLGTVVLCLPGHAITKDTWAQRSRDGKEMYTDPKDFDIVYDTYQGYRRTYLPVYEHSYLTSEIDETVENLVELTVNAELQKKAEFMRDNGIIGDPGVSSQILIIGEQVPESLERYDWAFVSNKGCSRRLAMELEAAQISERGLMWTNVRNSKGHELAPGSVSEVIKPRLVITLGIEAGKWAARHQVPAINLEHPAYHYRTKPHEVHPIIGLLKDDYAKNIRVR